MKKRASRISSVAVIAFLMATVFAASAAAAGRPALNTILPESVLARVLEEISGQRAFDNEVMMAGYNRIRTPEEMTGVMYEAEYLHKTMQGYGLDELRLESLKLFKPVRTTWWVGHEAELRLVEPVPMLLARLEDQPALLVRYSDTVDCRGELVFIDRADLASVKDRDLTGKIVLSPLNPARLSACFAKGALGVISYDNFVDALNNPDQVCFEMALDKGGAKGKVFGLKISIRQGNQLRDLILQGRKPVVHVRTRGAEYPWKADTIFAAVKGTAPDKPGLMFTAHLFERPSKIGANDNISGSVTLAEIARTLAALINSGRIARPERTIYFLMSEEGSGTAAFFQNHPEMAAKVLGDINMDMVGENLDANSAFLHIERPLYSKSGYLDAVVRMFAEYVFRGNIEVHGAEGSPLGDAFAVPVIEKNGSRQSFRYLMEPFSGGSDHGIFIESDADIPALSFMVWPDRWYHTDQDLPDKTDPTQLRRTAFIGACSALAVCAGDEATVVNLARAAYTDRLAFLQEAYEQGFERLSARRAADGGKAFREALNGVAQAGKLNAAALGRVRELAAGKTAASKYLDGLLAEAGKLRDEYWARLKDDYALASAAAGLKAEPVKPTADDILAARLVPVKPAPIALGDISVTTDLLKPFMGDNDLAVLVFDKMGFQALVEMYILSNGRNTLADIQDLLSFEFKPVEAADVIKVARALAAAKMIKLNAAM